MPEAYQDKSEEKIQSDISQEFKKNDGITRDDYEIYASARKVIDAYIKEITTGGEIYGPRALEEFKKLDKELSNEMNEMGGPALMFKNKETINDIANKIDNAEKIVLERLALNRSNAKTLNAINSPEKTKKYFNRDGAGILTFTSESNKPTIHEVLGNVFKNNTDIYNIDYSGCTNQNIKNKIISLTGMTSFYINYDSNEKTYLLSNSEGKKIDQRALIREGVKLIPSGVVSYGAKQADKKLIEEKNKNISSQSEIGKKTIDELKKDPKRSHIISIISSGLKSELEKDSNIYKDFLSKTEKRLDEIIKDAKSKNRELHTEPISKLNFSSGLMEVHLISGTAEKNVTLRNSVDHLGSQKLYDLLDGEEGGYKQYLTSRILQKRSEYDHLTKQENLISTNKEVKKEDLASTTEKTNALYGLGLMGKLVDNIKDDEGNTRANSNDRKIIDMLKYIRNTKYTLQTNQNIAKSDIQAIAIKLKELFNSYKFADKNQFIKLISGPKDQSVEAIRKIGEGLTTMDNTHTTFLRDEIIENDNLEIKETTYNSCFKKIGEILAIPEGEGEIPTNIKENIDALYIASTNSQGVLDFLKSKAMLPSSASLDDKTIKEGCEKIFNIIQNKKQIIDNFNITSEDMRKSLQEERNNLEIKDSKTSDDIGRLNAILFLLENPDTLEEQAQNQTEIMKNVTKYAGIDSEIKGAIGSRLIKKGGGITGTNSDIYNDSIGAGGWFDWSDENVAKTSEVLKMIAIEVAICVVAIAVGTFTAGVGTAAIYGARAAMIAARTVSLASKGNKVLKIMKLAGRFSNYKKYYQIGKITSKTLEVSAKAKKLAHIAEATNKLTKIGRIINPFVYGTELGVGIQSVVKGTALILEGTTFHLSSTILHNAVDGKMDIFEGTDPTGYMVLPDGTEMPNRKSYIQSIAFLGVLKALGQPIQTLTKTGLTKMMGEKLTVSMMGKAVQNMGSFSGEVGTLMGTEQILSLTFDQKLSPLTIDGFIHTIGMVAGLRGYGYAKLKLMSYKINPGNTSPESITMEVLSANGKKGKIIEVQKDGVTSNIITYKNAKGTIIKGEIIEKTASGEKPAEGYAMIKTPEGGIFSVKKTTLESNTSVELALLDVGNRIHYKNSAGKTIVGEIVATTAKGEKPAEGNVMIKKENGTYFSVEKESLLKSDFVKTFDFELGNRIWYTNQKGNVVSGEIIEKSPTGITPKAGEIMIQKDNGAIFSIKKISLESNTTLKISDFQTGDKIMYTNAKGNIVAGEIVEKTASGELPEEGYIMIKTNEGTIFSTKRSNFEAKDITTIKRDKIYNDKKLNTIVDKINSMIGGIKTKMQTLVEKIKTFFKTSERTQATEAEIAKEIEVQKEAAIGENEKNIVAETETVFNEGKENLEIPKELLTIDGQEFTSQVGAIKDLENIGKYKIVKVETNDGGFYILKPLGKGEYEVLDGSKPNIPKGTKTKISGSDIDFSSVGSGKLQGVKEAITGVSVLEPVVKAVKTSEKSTINPEIVKTNAQLIDQDRIETAKKLPGFEHITTEQEQAILEAHNVGSDREGAGVYNYTKIELLQKIRILEKAGLDGSQRRVLLENGICGNENVEGVSVLVDMSFDEWNNLSREQKEKIINEQEIWKDLKYLEITKGKKPTKEIMDEIIKTINTHKEYEKETIKEKQAQEKIEAITFKLKIENDYREFTELYQQDIIIPSEQIRLKELQEKIMKEYEDFINISEDGFITIDGPFGKIEKPKNVKKPEISGIYEEEVINSAGEKEKVYINKTALKDMLIESNGHLTELYQGRLIIMVKVGEIFMPFYRSSKGTDGKIEGNRYPFFGITTIGWIMKGSVNKNDGSMNYNNKAIEKVTETLNKIFKIPSSQLLNINKFFYEGAMEFSQNTSNNFTGFHPNSEVQNGSGTDGVRMDVIIKAIDGKYKNGEKKVMNDLLDMCNTWKKGRDRMATTYAIDMLIDSIITDIKNPQTLINSNVSELNGLKCLYEMYVGFGNSHSNVKDNQPNRINIQSNGFSKTERIYNTNINQSILLRDLLSEIILIHNKANTANNHRDYESEYRGFREPTDVELFAYMKERFPLFSLKSGGSTEKVKANAKLNDQERIETAKKLPGFEHMTNEVKNPEKIDFENINMDNIKAVLHTREYMSKLTYKQRNEIAIRYNMDPELVYLKSGITETKKWNIKESDYIPERQQLHEKIYQEDLESVLKLDERMGGEKPKLILMRGNSGVGKSTVLKNTHNADHPELKGFLEKLNLLDSNGELTGVLNPDVAKSKLRQYGSIDDNMLGSDKVHVEGGKISDRILDYMFKKGNSMVLDQCFLEQEWLNTVMDRGKNLGYDVILIDVYAPKEVAHDRIYGNSKLGIVGRDPKGPDPIPPIDRFNKGYDQMVGGREEAELQAKNRGIKYIFKDNTPR